MRRRISAAADSLKRHRMRLSVDIPVDPRVISSLSVISSLLVFWDPLLAVALALAFDLLDGAVARARGLTSREGGLFDYSCDRYSEFIFAAYYMRVTPLALLLPAANVMLTYRVVKGKGRILPLRSLLLFALLLKLII
ncbi:MAG: CDP-alcohol phosphatidyltransferase family protein [Candidatus Altiarchaeota archaeon]